ncbi:glycosyltransferase [Candidatus Collierbacteria bacterium]|nr:glycosyltransferase [Candidatus Collierbacteria bacterium]
MVVSMGTGNIGQNEKNMIHIVLPAFNEAESLKVLLPDLARTLNSERLAHKAYVVDDGSSDKTSKVVKNFSGRFPQIKLIVHKTNKGLAEAINTGFKEALKWSRSGDILITMDADNTHLPGLIVRMARLINEGNDIVISSRFVSGSRVRGVPLSRRLLSLSAGMILKILFPISGVKDYTCGFRAYRVDLIKKGIEIYKDKFISEKGFSCMVDILLKLRRLDPICAEVPMILRYDLKKGKSKMDVGKTIAETFKLIFRRL